MSKESLKALLEEALARLPQLRADYHSAWLESPDSDASRRAEQALENQRVIIIKLHQQLDSLNRGEAGGTGNICTPF